ncbi:MAG: aminopeptidase P family protein [Caulobacteraceae bacterium]|nr:aminopeptidase P family protein [Caulobacteraceae bacterium]
MFQSFDETADRAFGPRHVPSIRRAMIAAGLDAFLIPREDEHQNEYPPAANDRLGWATGFTGSAGMAIILRDGAAMFTDGRYALQVRDQVDPAVFHIGMLEDGGVEAFLTEVLRPGQTVGYDPRLHSPAALAGLGAAVARAGAALKPSAVNPVDEAWGADRPAQPAAPLTLHPLDLAGVSSADKRAALAAGLRADGVKAALLTAPPSIAWLFNVRGGDTIRAPLPFAQALLHDDGRAELFVEPGKVSPELAAWLGNTVSLGEPSGLVPALERLKGERVLVDPGQSSAWYFEAAALAGAVVVAGLDPCALPRAAKNAAEIEGARRAHRRDGAAVTTFLHWLAVEGQASPPDEIEAAGKLEGLRRATGELRDLSFDTVAGAGPNSAVIHYRPTTRTNRRCAPGELLLVDSGAQYVDGTTDVTRTVAIGEPSAEMRRRYTLVLKGHLALGRLRFPVGTTGSAVDAVARLALWRDGLDFDHGTGHGVGSYLSVHEGPQRISKAPNATALAPGMIVSNEPGYYKPGAYGIRIENLQTVTPAAPIPGGERPMLGFETLTLAPYDRRLIDVAILTGEERAQVDAYHARVAAEIGPLVEPAVRAWLGEACAPL